MRRQTVVSAMIAVASLLPATLFAQEAADSAHRLAADGLGLRTSENFSINEPNYFLAGFDGGSAIKRPPAEYSQQIKFRIAVRYRVAKIHKELSETGRHSDTGLYIGYTQNSFWHLLDPSAPFFDNNYQPKLFVHWDGGDVFKKCVRSCPSVRLFVEHESNGRDGDVSRSWNRFGVALGVGSDSSRVYGEVAGWNPFIVDELNADLADYAGRGEVRLYLQPFFNRSSHKYPLEDLGLEVRSRVGGTHLFQNVEANLFLDPGILWKGTRDCFLPSLTAQLFCGAGETLIDYRSSRCAVRVGLALLK